MAVDLSAANSLPQGADEFFRVFARFEFALKMAGLARMKQGRVEISWDDFAETGAIGDAFVAELRQRAICPTLFANPPQGEIITDGRYGFRDVEPPSSPSELFRAVRRVRNNLFHGGKYFDDDEERNAQLVAEAMATLLLAVERHPDVQFFFEGQA